MRASFRLGSLFGIAIFVHYTWFIIFLLVTLSLVQHFAASFPTLPVAGQWLIGLTASLLFFGSVLFHEMAHSLLAIQRGHAVRQITLFIFGGVSEIESEAKQPSTEIWIALIGPLSSYFLALAFGALWYLSRDVMPVISGVTGWLAVINAALGTFNLLPGLPLDGGRVLRGIAWRLTGNPERATRIAAGAGRTLGYLIILYGAWLAFGLNSFANGLWLVFIGWFLTNAAESTVQQMQMRRALAGVQAVQAMTRDCPAVSGGISLTEFVEQFLLPSGRRCFIVGERELPRGIITLTDVRAVPRDQWEVTSVQAVMRPLAQLHAVTPGTEIEQVLRLMDEHNIGQVAVMQDGQLLGLIRRDHLLRLIRNRLELAA
jgi:Zn-dependent protease/CBS domain-containing protein